MTNEHNPIAQLVTKIQQRWTEEITPNQTVKLIRWLIDLQETKLYEGFLRIESSPGKRLSEYFITLLTPFKSYATYSQDLIKSWFENFDKEKEGFAELTINGKAFAWDDDYFRQKLISPNVNPDKLLLELLSSYHAALHIGDRKMTIALFQQSITSTDEYNEWIKTIYKLEIPEHIQFCIFDLKEERFYEKLFSKLDPAIARTLISDLDLAGAIKKVIQAGDPNEPGTRLQQYIQQMSEAVAEKDLSKLEKRGNACIQDMALSKVKSLMATAHITFAGMLFSFKQYDSIESLLNNGLKIAEAGKKAGDITCQALIMQFYSFKASNYQLNKKNKEAVEWFFKSGESAMETNLVIPAITAYRQAAYLSKKHDAQKYPQILKRGYEAGEGLIEEQLSISGYTFICFDYCDYLNQNQQFEKSNEIDKRMKEIAGINWKEEAGEKVMNFTKATASLT
jgi:hypothetical protein